MKFTQGVSLKGNNTLASDVKAAYFVSISREVDLLRALKERPLALPCLVMGGGSNIVLTSDFDGVVLHNAIQGIELIREDERYVWVRSAGGVEWHALVQWAIRRGFSGVENLSLIPGTVGAAPIQNIGAYGVELCDVFVSLEAIEIATGRRVSRDVDMCEFAYRHSVFKTEEYAGKWIIVSVTLKLQKTPRYVTGYGEIEAELAARKEELTPQLMSDVIVSIRQRKLPDPSVLPNCGSFFKNPIVDKFELAKIKGTLPGVINYPLDDGRYKLAAGWIIDQLGWKGREFEGAKVHDKQALVLINQGGGGKAVVNLSRKINEDVFAMLGIYLEPEPQFVGRKTTVLL